MPIVSDDNVRHINPDSNGEGQTEPEDPRLNWSVILDAPEIAAFLKKPDTPRAREYRDKVNSLFNTALQFRLADPNGLADVSTILHRGPAVSLRAGALADDNESFRRALDLITAPDNPAVMFALAFIPLVTQLFRNHEGQIQEARNVRAARRTMTRDERKAAKAARPRVEFRFLGRTFRMPFRFKVNIGAVLRTNTVPPEFMVASVIGNPQVRAELTKRFGVKWGAANAAPDDN